jgi:hypothetical protein
MGSTRNRLLAESTAFAVENFPDLRSRLHPLSLKRFSYRAQNASLKLNGLDRAYVIPTLGGQYAKHVKAQPSCARVRQP